MSFYFAVLLRDSIIFGCDRTIKNETTGELRTDIKRYSLLPGGRVFLPTGNLIFALPVRKLMQGAFEFSLELFDGNKSFWQERLLSLYRPVEKANKEVLKKMGKPVEIENFDCLFGGLHEKIPIIFSLTSANDFKLKAVKGPAYITLNQTPALLSFAQKTLKGFLGAAIDMSHHETWDLAQRFLPAIIQKLSEEDPLISSCGDLIFLSEKRIFLFEF